MRVFPGVTLALTGDATGTSGVWDGYTDLSVAVTLATVTVAKGGTGITSYAVGDLLYASGATALSKLADVATGNALISGGVGVAPSWGKIGLTTHVSGTLAAANGGTGNATYAVGDLLYASGATALSRLADVATGNVLRSGGVGVAPAWGKVALATDVSGTLPGANMAAATDAAQGAVELATAAEVQTGTDTTRAVTSAGLRACTATTARAGVIETATDAEAQAGTSTAVAVTPSNLAASVLGMNQTWQDVTASRSSGTEYTNSTGKPIQVTVVIVGTGAGQGSVIIGGVTVVSSIVLAVNATIPFSFVIAPSDTYKFTLTAGSFHKWVELR